MNNRVIDLVRWIQESGFTVENKRAFLTITLLGADSETCYNVLENKTATIEFDEVLLEEVLAHASIDGIADILWSPFGYQLSLHFFRKVFQQAISAASDINDLHKLVGAAVDILKKYPLAFELPPPLSRQLLSSQNVEHRVVGLKALCYGSEDTSEALVAVVRALDKNESYETFGGLYELGQMLERKGRSIVDSVDSPIIARLAQALDTVISDNVDSDARISASRRLSELNRLLDRD